MGNQFISNTKQHKLTYIKLSTFKQSLLQQTNKFPYSFNHSLIFYIILSSNTISESNTIISVLHIQLHHSATTFISFIPQFGSSLSHSTLTQFIHFTPHSLSFISYYSTRGLRPSVLCGGRGASAAPP